MDFKLKAPFEPMGDQPTAINDLVEGLNSGERDQVLLGVTGSGKTLPWPTLLNVHSAPVLSSVTIKPWPHSSTVK